MSASMSASLSSQVSRKRKSAASNASNNIGNERAAKKRSHHAAGASVEGASNTPPMPRSTTVTTTANTPTTPTKFSINTRLSSYNPKIKNPRAHYDAAVAAMTDRAARTGYTTALVRKFCEANRADCDSLAAYQHLLTDTRRQLTSLGADPGDAFAVWVALTGLREMHRRWYGKLVTDVAAGRMDWDTLMASMAERACREKQRAEPQ